MGLDFGTQSVKIGIYNEFGELIQISNRKYDTTFSKSGYSEQDPNSWWVGLKEAIQGFDNTNLLNKIKGISVCATSSTVLVTNNKMEPITKAQCWMDQRAVKEEEIINTSTDPLVKKYLSYSGGKTSVEWMLTKSLWIKRNMDLSEKIIMEQLDWINYRLTGALVASKCNASCKWGYVDELGGFSEEFFRKIGLSNIKDHWPNVILKVGEKIGELTTDSAIFLGLPEGIPVFQGGIDAHIGMIGSGALEFGYLTMIAGTSFVHLMHNETPVFNDSLWGPYDSPLINNHWLLEGGQLSCGSIITWFMNEFYPNLNATDYQSVLNELEKKMNVIDVGSEGLICLDSWKGNRTPYKNAYASGAFVGLTLSHTKYHIYRAILESIAYGTKNVIETFNRLSIKVDRIIAGGGGTNNRLWMQVISDVTGLPIYTPTDQETGVKGAAAVAAYGLGIYPTLKDASKIMVSTKKTYIPDLSKTKKYEKWFNLYLELNEKLFPIMRKIKAGEEEDNYEIGT